MTTAEPAPILFVHAADEAYGADRVLLDLVRGLRDRGRRVEVLVPDDLPPGWLSARLAEAGIDVRRGPLAPARRRYLRLAGLPAYLVDLIRARRFVRGRAVALRAGIVHMNTSALLVAAILGHPAGARLVWHIHEIIVRPRLLGRLFRWLPTARADRVVAVSDAVRRHLAGGRQASQRVVTVHNGIAPRERAPLASLAGDAPVVAFVGRLNRWKGHEIFVRAVTLLAPRWPMVRFVIAGDAPPGEEWRETDLDARVAAIGLGGRIERLGFIPDGASVLEAADVAVAPSTWPDPLPNVVLEAMRAGCAVVASNHGGAPEMIVDGESGVLVPPSDAAALTAAIDALLADPDRRARLGAAARARVASAFTIDRMLDEIERVYAELET